MICNVAEEDTFAKNPKNAMLNNTALAFVQGSLKCVLKCKSYAKDIAIHAVSLGLSYMITI